MIFYRQLLKINRKHKFFVILHFLFCAPDVFSMEAEETNNTLRACFSSNEDAFNTENEEFFTLDVNKKEKILCVLLFLNSSKNSFSTADTDKRTRIQRHIDAEKQGFLEPLIQLYKKGQESDDSNDTCSESYEEYDEEFLWKTSKFNYLEDHPSTKDDKTSKQKLSSSAMRKHSNINSS